MRRPSFFALTVLLCAPTGFCQTASTDSQTLQALLQEVRQLRQELRTTSAAAQRAQILIYRLQAQEAAVARASQHLEDARSKLAQKGDVRSQVAYELKRYEDMRDRAENAAQQKEYNRAIIGYKTQMDTLATEQQELQAKEADCREELRIEETKLGRLQDDLDRAGKSLENSVSSSNGAGQQHP